MSSLDDLINGMLADVKKQKAAKKSAKKQAATTGVLPIGRAPILNPWRDEFLTMIQLVNTCKHCGNETVSWEPHIYMEKHRIVNGKLERHIEQLHCSNIDDLYGHYPKRIETREQATCHCPQCFYDLPQAVGGLQLNLPFGKPHDIQSI